MARRESPTLPSRRIDLSTLRDIRLEMAAVYPRINSGEIEPSEGSKLVYVLRQIGDIIEMADIEKRIEDHFGCGKTVGRIRQTVYRGMRRVDQHFKLTMTASNIVRIARMLCADPQAAAQ